MRRLASPSLGFLDFAHEDAGNYRISALAQRHGIQLTKASERVSSKQAGKEAAERLQVEFDHSTAQARPRHLYLGWLSRRMASGTL